MCLYFKRALQMHQIVNFIIYYTHLYHSWCKLPMDKFWSQKPKSASLHPQTKPCRLLDIYNATYHTQLPQKFPLNTFQKQVSSLLQDSWFMVQPYQDQPYPEALINILKIILIWRAICEQMRLC